MQTGRILSFLCFTAAVLFLAAETCALLTGHKSPAVYGAVIHSAVENVVLAIAGAGAGFMLHRGRSRLGSWIALWVSGLGMWEFWAWPLLKGRLIPLRSYFVSPVSLVILDAIKEIVLPLLFIFSLVVLFSRQTSASEEPATNSARGWPVFGILSIAFPLAGIPIGFGVAKSVSTADPWSPLAFLFLSAYVAIILGFICVLAAYVRWEKWQVLPFIGFLLNTTPMLWASHAFIIHDTRALILADVFCCICTILCLAAKELRRTWALMAAVPSVFMLFSMLVPGVTEILIRIR